MGEVGDGDALEAGELADELGVLLVHADIVMVLMVSPCGREYGVLMGLRPRNARRPLWRCGQLALGP